MSQGMYLFCLARLSRLPDLPLEGKGLDGQSPLAVASFQDLAAVWSPVSLADFSGPAAEERLRDPVWIGPRVIRHQEVVVGVMRHSPVLPAKFGIIFASAANLEKVLREHHDTIDGFLELMTGREEWAVKGMLDRSAAREHLYAGQLAREVERLDALSPGKRYFEEQRLRTQSDRELNPWLKEICRELEVDLRTHAAEIRPRRLLSREVTGRDRDMVLNWALLVAGEAVPRFQACIQAANAQYAHRGLALESSGPWPPYSFTPTLGGEPDA